MDTIRTTYKYYLQCFATDDFAGKEVRESQEKCYVNNRNEYLTYAVDGLMVPSQGDTR